jgi:hypothetical protein
VKKGGAPLSFSEMAKRPGNPQPVRRIPFPEKTIAQTNRPRAFFKVRAFPFQVWVGAIDLKVPKREIFVTDLFILSDPIWIGDPRNEPKKPFV